MQCVSAAIRPLNVTGKMPAPEKDGRHPKYENHGRIAGRCSLSSVLQSCAWFSCFWGPALRDFMKEDTNVQ
jgi:hypothetical protein